MGRDSARGGVGANWRPDGPVAYRRDSAGSRIACLPRTCRHGDHDLHAVGYRATETDGILRVSCLACANMPRADHAWALVVGPDRPDRAELDDTPYAALRAKITR